MDTTATYYIVQMTPDLFRREPVNVGVFVRKAGQFAARFVGEKTPGNGDIDGRKVRGLPAPGVYMQWVEYWKRTLDSSTNPVEELMKTNSSNYNVIAGGEVDGTDIDSAEDVANYLYPLLVSTGGLREALGLQDEQVPEVAVAKLRDSIDDAFQELDILATTPEIKWVPHPIVKGRPVIGKSVQHQPSYVQENGTLWVMEAVDFTVRSKVYARDHAGWAAFMFKDIREGMTKGKDVSSIAIVKVDSDEQSDSQVRYGLDMLKDTTDEIVDWRDQAHRSRFIRQREQIAKSFTS
jgi:hypothetical protein